ncbi:uncharacterized protein SCDLUD_002983 [Saccharomycodes ludwigii]|uniref:uncharacterized protein n=1 Tax=Saccharomycodes ludwigii TaxID=36035 RepID=UPI001E8B90A9|nr:hypothetical protein SCDLUD_002983 [Saccharomycodes ludwigii]KAH3901487.1 hypothetical protein SCDLUD_002983 [Saccharomycodes ludwigii]
MNYNILRNNSSNRKSGGYQDKVQVLPYSTTEDNKRTKFLPSHESLLQSKRRISKINRLFNQQDNQDENTVEKDNYIKKDVDESITPRLDKKFISRSDGPNSVTRRINKNYDPKTEKEEKQSYIYNKKRIHDYRRVNNHHLYFNDDSTTKIDQAPNFYGEDPPFKPTFKDNIINSSAKPIPKGDSILYTHPISSQQSTAYTAAIRRTNLNFGVPIPLPYLTETNHNKMTFRESLSENSEPSSTYSTGGRNIRDNSRFANQKNGNVTAVSVENDIQYINIDTMEDLEQLKKSITNNYIRFMRDLDKFTKLHNDYSKGTTLKANGFFLFRHSGRLYFWLFCIIMLLILNILLYYYYYFYIAF